MSASGFSRPADRSWLRRPVYYHHAPLPAREARVPLELGLLAAALLVLAFIFV